MRCVQDKPAGRNTAVSAKANGPSLVQAAIERALTYDKCLRLEGQDRLACFLDRATINVGAMFAKQVQGRVSTEVCG